MAEDRMQLLQEADQRGLLPPDMKSAFEEAKKRGLIQGLQATQQQPPQERGIVDKLFGLTGPRYQTFPERAAREVFGDVKQLMDQNSGAVGDIEKTAELGPKGLKVASETYFGGAPGAAHAAGASVDTLLKARELKGALPTTAEIKSSAQTAYKAVEDARLIASADSLNDLVSATRAGLDERFLADSGVAKQAMAQLEKSNGDIAGILSVRQHLGEVQPTAGSDYAAAQHIRDAIDHYIETLPQDAIVQGDPQFTQAMLEHARSSWKAYAQLDQIETAMRVGEHRAAVSGTGANSQNAMRQRIREILDSDKKSRGYSKEAKEQMENIAVGTAVTNAARYAGKFAPSGPVSAMAAGTAAFLGGGATEHGMVAAAGVAIPATIAKYLGTFLTKRQISALEDIIRAESPLGQAAERRVMGQSTGAAGRAVEVAAPAAVPLSTGAVQSYLDQQRFP